MTSSLCCINNCSITNLPVITVDHVGRLPCGQGGTLPWNRNWETPVSLFKLLFFLFDFLIFICWGLVNYFFLFIFLEPLKSFQNKLQDVWYFFFIFLHGDNRRKLRWMTKYFLEGENEVKCGGRHAIDKIDDSGESMRPICERKRCMRKKRETSFNNMTVLSFWITIIFWCMWGVVRWEILLIERKLARAWYSPPLSV